MNKTLLNKLVKLFKQHLPEGVVILFVVWLTALATITLLPGPYTLDFFGVVAERNDNSASATVGFAAVFIALVVIPLGLAIAEMLKKD